MIRAVLLALAIATLPACMTPVGAPRVPVVAADAEPARYPPRSGPLTEREMEIARTAWKYFENNYQPATGFVNAVDTYPSTTMWDTASSVGALYAARELGLIDKLTFDGKLRTLLKTLNTMSFFRDELPNKVYHAATGAMVNYSNKPGEIGFSAIDLGRLLIWLTLVKERYPEHANAIDRFVLRWDFTHVVDPCGTMYGAMLTADKKVSYVQEGRLGYEEYAAKGFQLWGFSTCLASRPEPFNTAPIYCVEVPYDTRDPRALAQHNYVVTESYALYGMELGWRPRAEADTAGRRAAEDWVEEFARRVYQAQENRFRDTGILTARSEHQLKAAPYFVYDTVYSDGFAWNTITDKGAFVPSSAAISLKAALGMWVLWQSPYTDLLFDAIAEASVTDKGYYEGIFENGTGPIPVYTANNNGIMLEALLFKAQGTLLARGPVAAGIWEQTLSDPFPPNDKHRPRMTCTNAGGAERGETCPISRQYCRKEASQGCQTCACPSCRDDMPVNYSRASSCPLR
jgi:Protein of unknown function (DUF3131)